MSDETIYKAEHLLIPELGLAFITSNDYHTIDLSDHPAKVEIINLEKIILDAIKYQDPILEDSRIKMKELLEKSIYCLSAKKSMISWSNIMYQIWILKIDSLRKELTQKLSQR